MKEILTILFFTIGMFSYGQTYPMPDYINTPSFYNGTELVELEAIQFVVGSRPKGLYGAEAALYFNGTTSGIEIDADNAQFIVKLESGVNPKTLMDIDIAQVNKKSGKREIVIYQKGMMTAEGTTQSIGLDFEKIDDGFYLVKAKSELVSGEYFFTLLANSKSRIAYGFTIK